MSRINVKPKKVSLTDYGVGKNPTNTPAPTLYEGTPKLYDMYSNSLGPTDIESDLNDLAKRAKMAVSKNAETPTGTKSIGSLATTPTTYNATTKPAEPVKATTGTTDYKPMWDMYRSQLAQSNVNQKAELAAINEKANSYVNNYLKALGLSGTSAGASQIAQNNMNLMNAYNQVNRDTQNQENYYNEQEYKENEARRLEAKNDATAQADAKAKEQEINSERLEKAYTLALQQGASARQLNEMLNNANPDNLTAGTIDYLRSLGGSALDWESDKELALDNLYELATSTNLNYLKDYYNQINNAKTEEEYYSLMDRYQDQLSERAIADRINKNTEEYNNAIKTLDNYANGKMSESEYNEFVNTPEYKEAIKRAKLPDKIAVVGLNTKYQEIDSNNIPYSVYKDGAVGNRKSQIKKALEEILKEKYTL